MPDVPDRLMSPDGQSGWFAYAPPGGRTEDEPIQWNAPPDGAKIKVMGEYGVEVPLWYRGLLFGSPDEVVHEWGISEELAADLAAWGLSWEDHVRSPEHDARGVELTARLNEVLGSRYRFVFHR